LAVIFAAIGGLLATIHPAEATNILVFQDVRHRNVEVSNMTDVFGSNFTSYDSYADWTHPPSSRVYAFRLPGRCRRERHELDRLSVDLRLDGAGWVSHGGRLLLQSAGTSSAIRVSRSVRDARPSASRRQ